MGWTVTKEKLHSLSKQPADRATLEQTELEQTSNSARHHSMRCLSSSKVNMKNDSAFSLWLTNGFTVRKNAMKSEPQTNRPERKFAASSD
jgi:hypothetical protein